MDKIQGLAIDIDSTQEKSALNTSDLFMCIRTCF